MSFSPNDLGEIFNLATAIGLVDSAGDFQEDWLTKPGDYLSEMLANEAQRQALVAFIDEVLGGSERRTDAAGRIWLPIIEADNPDITFYLVLDESPAPHIRIGLGVGISTTGPQSQTTLHVPLFRAAKQSHSVSDVILLGSSEGRIVFSTEITVDESAPTPGAAHLGRVGVGLEVPTAAGQQPVMSLTLGALQLPGAQAPRDFSISLDSLDELDDAALNLVLGLIQAQAAGLPGGPLSALAGLIGLKNGGAIPPLPIANLPNLGPRAMAQWFDSIVAQASARAAWLGELAALVSSGAVVGTDGVSFGLGPAQVTLAVRSAAGAHGASIITPALSAIITSGSIRAVADIALANIDLGNGSAVALPRMSIVAHAGHTSAGGTTLLAGDPAVDAVRIGIALDGERKPIPILAADGVTIGAHHFDTLDLSTPDAVVESLGNVLDDVVDDLLGQLGPIGTALRVLLGLSPPPGAPAAPTVSLATFLANPLAAVGDHWRFLLHDHADAVPAVLDSLRTLIADAGATIPPITGTGTAADPWHMPLVGPAALQFYRDGGSDQLFVGLSARYAVDTLGQRCTRIESRLTVGLAKIDLAAHTLVLAASIEAQLTARARGDTRARFTAGPIALSADHIGISGRWSQETSLKVEALAPNAAAEVMGQAIPIALPTFGPDGSPILDEAGWEAVQRLLGLLGSQSPLPAFRDLVDALGWITDGRNLADDPEASGRPQLRLAALVANPTDALKAWSIALLLREAGPLENALLVLARQLTGTVDDLGRLSGLGSVDAPYRLALFGDGVSPDLAFWLEPHGPGRPTITTVPNELRDWRPGIPGLEPEALAAAVIGEGRIATAIATLVAGRADLSAGFGALADRWIGTDGRILPPTTDPDGINVHRLLDLTCDQLAGAIDVDEILEGPPSVRINVAVVAAGSPLPWPAAPATRIIDLRAPGLTPESFPAPDAAAGEWFIALGERAAARLATGDVDGIAGQAARLQRVLPAFNEMGGVALISDAAAGHAARMAAEAVNAVTALITLGTAPGPVSFTVLDIAPAAEALRVMIALLPASDPAQPDDPDLARGRALIGALAGLLPLGDPGVELRPPATLPSVPRAGLTVHSVFGVLSEDAVRAAMTAVVAAGLSIRAGVRADALLVEGITGGGLGFVVPLSVRAGGLAIEGQITVEALGFDLSNPLAPTIRTANALRIQISFARESGWLIGGPDPSRGPGPRPEHELRRIEATLVLPLHGNVAASAELVLIEPKVFGIGRDRWVVRASGAATIAAEVVTPALPEVRVLLAQFAAQLAAASAPELTAVKQLLSGLGLIDASGGWVADGIDHLLNEPLARVHDALNNAVQRAQLQSSIAALLGAVPGLGIDLAARSLTLSLGGAPGTIGLKPWNLTFDAAAGSAPQFRFTLEAAGDSPEGGLAVRFSSSPLALTLERHHPGAATSESIPIWPDPDGGRILAAVTRIAPAELARLGLDYLRKLDATVQPVIDAAYDAFGLLGAPDGGGRRNVRLPLALIENPIGWLSHAGALGGSGGFDPAKIIAFVDAFKPILGIAGGPGEWNLAGGFVLRADALAGAARLGLQIDSSGFAPVSGAVGRLVLRGVFALSLPTGLPPRPAIDVSVGISGAAPGRRAVHVSSDGGLQVFIRPDTGPDISLYPNPPGLASLAQAAVGQALPMILDAIASQTGAGLAANVGAAVRALGDALALRSGAPPHFDGAALQAFANGPAAAFAARLPALSTAAINALASALGPLLPAPVSVSVVSGKLTVTVHGVTIALQPSPFELAVGADLSDLPAIEELDLSITLNATGLAALEVELGPANINAGGVHLHPSLSIAAGASPPNGRHVLLGLALDPAGNRIVGARWLIDPASFALVTVNGASPPITDPAQVALALIDAVVQLVASFAISTDAVGDLLDKTLPGSPTNVRNALRGVFLADVADPSSLDSNLFDPAVLLTRLKRLLKNLAIAHPSIAIPGGLTVGMGLNGTTAALTLGIAGRADLNDGDVVVSIEADSRWIQGTPPAGLALGFLETTGEMDFAPSIGVNGIGIRISRKSGPLIDAGLTVGSIALHAYSMISSTEISGGAQIQLSDLAAGVANASGGNPIAQGMVADSGSGPEKLAPSFSPALAVQKHGAGSILFSLRAGEGDGPWWLAIQKGFGPIYIEQVGFDTTVTNDQLIDISILLDGRVSIAGLTASVDDLGLTFTVASDASVFDPGRWRVDLAGLAVEADMGGVVLAGGLRKFGNGENVEYVGMLLARFAVYGLSIYGGYGTKVENGSRFTAFFAFGAINGPIGGPPAFFLTGIGGGIGINRDLIFPTELNRFGDFPFIRALDPGAEPSGDPMADLLALRDIFPMKRGDFWFAAGISFNSFALVDGIAVVSVKIGDGFELALLGLARMALPRPQVALVSIELGLIARFSTKEGVIWVQAQLTDNSWLLHESVRLTGGFAFVSWFDGPRKGEFVLTIGGFHPSFHRDGYPVVPRLGFSWNFGVVAIKGENYFALTSEALMAGGKLEASAHFGPAWAQVVFGADGIVYFDPFRFSVTVYARISAGITIDVWIGEITISISIGARITVEGPKFRGTATFEVGPVELTVSFGDTEDAPHTYLHWSDFVPKYLEDAGGGVARCVTALPGKGSLPPGTGTAGSSESGTADGSVAKPFEVFSEFEITVTTIVPTTRVTFGVPSVDQAASADLGLAPANVHTIESNLELHLRDSAANDHLPAIFADNQQIKEIHRSNGFPVGVWGGPQPLDDKKIPKGEVIEAIDGVRFEFRALLQDTLPQEMAYFQVESGPRKPLPFLHARRFRADLISAANATAAVVPGELSVAQMYTDAKPWLALGGNGATALAVLAQERTAPPRLGSLTENLASVETRRPRITLPKDAVRPPIDTLVRPPTAVAILRGEPMHELHAPRTTVADSGGAELMAAPRLTDIEAALDWAIPAKLVRMTAPAATTDRTLLSSGAVPLTRTGQAGVAAVASRGAATAGRTRLAALTQALGPQSRQAVHAAAPAATISPSEIAVLSMPNAKRDVDTQAPRPRLIASGPARFVAMGAGGRVISDALAARTGLTVPRGTERIAVLALGQRSDKQTVAGAFGWHDSQSLAYIGWSSAMIPGGILHAEGSAPQRGRQRFRAGWVAASDLTAAAAVVTTRFTVPIACVALIIDDPAGTAAAQNLSLGLTGADVAADQAGQALPPTVIVIGNRSLLIYGIRPLAGKDDNAVHVSIAREPGWRVSGVLASTDASDVFADRLLNGGLERAVRPLAEGREGAITLSWSPGRPIRPQPPTSPTPSPSLPSRPTAASRRPKANKMKVKAKTKAKAKAKAKAKTKTTKQK